MNNYLDKVDLVRFTDRINESFRGRIKYKGTLPIIPTGQTTRGDWSDIAPCYVGHAYVLTGSAEQYIVIDDIRYNVGDLVFATNEVTKDSSGGLSAAVTVQKISGVANPRIDNKTIIENQDPTYSRGGDFMTAVGGWTETSKNQLAAEKKFTLDAVATEIKVPAKAYPANGESVMITMVYPSGGSTSESGTYDSYTKKVTTITYYIESDETTSPYITIKNKDASAFAAGSYSVKVSITKATDVESIHTSDPKYIEKDNYTVVIDDLGSVKAKSAIEIDTFPDFALAKTEVLYRLLTNQIISGKQYPAGLYVCDKSDAANPQWLSVGGTKMDEKTIKTKNLYGSNVVPAHTEIGGSLLSKDGIGAGPFIMSITTDANGELINVANIINKSFINAIIDAGVFSTETSYQLNFTKDSKDICVDNIKLVKYPTEKESIQNSSFELKGDYIDIIVSYDGTNYNGTINASKEIGLAANTTYTNNYLCFNINPIYSYVNNNYLNLDNTTITDINPLDRTAGPLHAKSAVEVATFPVTNILPETIYRLTAEITIGDKKYAPGLYVYDTTNSTNPIWLSVGGSEVDEKTILSTEDDGTLSPLHTRISGWKGTSDTIDIGNRFTSIIYNHTAGDSTYMLSQLSPASTFDYTEFTNNISGTSAVNIKLTFADGDLEFIGTCNGSGSIGSYIGTQTDKILAASIMFFLDGDKHTTFTMSINVKSGYESLTGTPTLSIKFTDKKDVIHPIKSEYLNIDNNTIYLKNLSETPFEETNIIKSKAVIEKSGLPDTPTNDYKENVIYKLNSDSSTMKTGYYIANFNGPAHWDYYGEGIDNNTVLAKHPEDSSNTNKNLHTAVEGNYELIPASHGIYRFSFPIGNPGAECYIYNLNDEISIVNLTNIKLALDTYFDLTKVSDKVWEGTGTVSDDYRFYAKLEIINKFESKLYVRQETGSGTGSVTLGLRYDYSDTVAYKPLITEFINVDEKTTIVDSDNIKFGRSLLRAKSVIPVDELPAASEVISNVIYWLRNDYTSVVEWKAGFYTYVDGNYKKIDTPIEIDEKTIRSKDDSGNDKPLYTQIGGSKDYITNDLHAITLPFDPYINVSGTDIICTISNTEMTASNKDFLKINAVIEFPEIIINTIYGGTETIAAETYKCISLTSSDLIGNFESSSGNTLMYVWSPSGYFTGLELTLKNGFSQHPDLDFITINDDPVCYYYDISYVDNNYIEINDITMDKISNGSTTKPNVMLSAKSAIEVEKLSDITNPLTEVLYRLTAEETISGTRYTKGLYVYDSTSTPNIWLKVGGSDIDEYTIVKTNDDLLETVVGGGTDDVEAFRILNNSKKISTCNFTSGTDYFETDRIPMDQITRSPKNVSIKTIECAFSDGTRSTYNDLWYHTTTTEDNGSSLTLYLDGSSNKSYITIYDNQEIQFHFASTKKCVYLEVISHAYAYYDSYVLSNPDFICKDGTTLKLNNDGLLSTTVGGSGTSQQSLFSSTINVSATALNNTTHTLYIEMTPDNIIQGTPNYIYIEGISVVTEESGSYTESFKYKLKFKDGSGVVYADAKNDCNLNSSSSNFVDYLDIDTTGKMHLYTNHFSDITSKTRTFTIVGNATVSKIYLEYSTIDYIDNNYVNVDDVTVIRNTRNNKLKSNSIIYVTDLPDVYNADPNVIYNIINTKNYYTYNKYTESYESISGIPVAFDEKTILSTDHSGSAAPVHTEIGGSINLGTPMIKENDITSSMTRVRTTWTGVYTETEAYAPYSIDDTFYVDILASNDVGYTGYLKHWKFDSVEGHMFSISGDDTNTKVNIRVLDNKDGTYNIEVVFDAESTTATLTKAIVKSYLFDSKEISTIHSQYIPIDNYTISSDNNYNIIKANAVVVVSSLPTTNIDPQIIFNLTSVSGYMPKGYYIYNPRSNLDNKWECINNRILNVSQVTSIPASNIDYGSIYYQTQDVTDYPKGYYVYNTSISKWTKLGVTLGTHTLGSTTLGSGLILDSEDKLKVNLKTFTDSSTVVWDSPIVVDNDKYLNIDTGIGLAYNNPILSIGETACGLHIRLGGSNSALSGGGLKLTSSDTEDRKRNGSLAINLSETSCLTTANGILESNLCSVNTGNLQTISSTISNWYDRGNNASYSSGAPTLGYSLRFPEGTIGSNSIIKINSITYANGETITVNKNLTYVRDNNYTTKVGTPNASYGRYVYIEEEESEYLYFEMAIGKFEMLNSILFEISNINIFKRINNPYFRNSKISSINVTLVYSTEINKIQGQWISTNDSDIKVDALGQLILNHSVLTGTAAPTSSDGKNGDVYFQYST